MKVLIDQREVHVPPGTTILEAARQAGIDIPTLCHLNGFQPSTSCLVCVVKVCGRNKLVPSCATLVVDGMEVQSNTPEVHQARQTALELLLSDHIGDCLAPCYFACPAHMDVPLMLRQIAQEDFGQAIITVKQQIALPATLGRICPAPCEKGCRRGAADGPVAVCQMKRFVADWDLRSDTPYAPECAPDTGHRVAIIGAGPTGLSAACYLRQLGHAVTIFDAAQQPGGRLWTETTEFQLPREILLAEIQQVLRLGVEFNGQSPVEDRATLDDLRSDFNAVLLACGAMDLAMVETWGLATASRGVLADKRTFLTSLPKVFAAGNAVRGKAMVVRSVADGREAAAAIDRFLTDQSSAAPPKPFSTRAGRLQDSQLSDLLSLAGTAPRCEPTGGADAEYTVDEAVQQAGRCLHCDCRGADACKLRRYAAEYGADPNRYRSQRQRIEISDQHSLVLYEPGKCIQCGLCIQIATAAGEPLGLTFVGRGFDVHVGVPFNRSLEEALSKVAAQCVAACPTAALTLRPERADLPILYRP